MADEFPVAQKQADAVAQQMQALLQKGDAVCRVRVAALVVQQLPVQRDGDVPTARHDHQDIDLALAKIPFRPVYAQRYLPTFGQEHRQQQGHLFIIKGYLPKKVLYARFVR